MTTRTKNQVNHCREIRKSFPTPGARERHRFAIGGSCEGDVFPSPTATAPARADRSRAASYSPLASALQLVKCATMFIAAVVNCHRYERRASRGTAISRSEMVLFVFRPSHGKAGASPEQIWIPISLTNASDRRIFDPADCAAGGYRMRRNDKATVGEMREGMTLRRVRAATGACR
jgi:hypothetical protein